jgi:hypothetical protein
MPAFDPSNPFGEEGLLACMIRLANERDQSWRFTKKGDKRPRQDVEASIAGRRKAAKARRVANAGETPNRRKRVRVAPGASIAHRMLKAMEPGNWYGRGDLMRMVGADKDQRSTVKRIMMKRGWVESVPNPAYTGRRFTPQEIQAGAEPEPEKLYRLTEVGLHIRRALANPT